MQKYNLHAKNEILRGCDHVLRRLDSERSCPMGYSVPRKIECHSACGLVAFYLCSGHYIP